ncbi:hypothetical protein ACTFSJ_27695 [Bacillus cereus group sp. MYBK12-2]|uniref:hypothetical protein n=1 Tax=Bacillus cereus group sp. MYBK12-2 TaxID=3450689 RepID=UPI0032FBFB91|nr:hypothetical protein [Bacillus pacificus]HDR7653596.1 hypothetical protein [Bacillus pacificus]
MIKKKRTPSDKTLKNRLIARRKMITFRIIPDRTASNKRNHDFMRAIHDFDKSFLKRIDWKQKQIQERMKFFWDIVMSADDISFFCTVPAEKASFVKQQLELTWEKAAIQEEEIIFPFEAEQQQMQICEMSLTRHNIFSLKVDRRMEIEPLGSILIGSKELKDDDWARIQICCDPISRINWQDQTKKHHAKFKSGRTPKRIRISKHDLLLGAGDAFCGVMDQVAEGMDILMDSLAGKASEKDKEIRKRLLEGDDIEKRMLLIDGSLQNSTQKKRTLPTFKTWIRIQAASKDPGRRESLINTISNAFHDLSGDNELQRIEISKSGQKRLAQEITDFSLSLQSQLHPDVMVLSNLELGRLIELPTAKLQDDFHFQSINKREVKIPDALKQGIPWGVVSLKGSQELVHLPIKNWGLLCRPQVILGKMGCGKTTLGSQIGSNFPKAGFTAILMDTADGGLIDDAINALPEDFPESHIIDLDFGNMLHVIPSDWSEMTAGFKVNGEWDEVEVNRRKAANRLSSILIDFIDKLATYETTDRMERYLGAVAKVILSNPNRGLMEVILCLTSDEYRANVLKSFKITDPIIYGTIQELHDMSPESRTQITKAIMSRINVLLSNDTMRNSLLQRPKTDQNGQPLINVRKWIDGNPETNPKYGGAYFVGIRIPKSELFDLATDRLATFWDAKIWLAALSRYDLPKKKGCHGKPFVYVRDEPHQTPTAFHIHNDACREARKWGMKNIWLAHKLEDFDFMKKTLKDAGAQYTMFATSKETVRSLKEELHPFTEEDLLQIPEQRYAVNKFAESDGSFMSKTIDLEFVKDRSHIRESCSKKYGKPLNEVEHDIFERTKVLLQKNDGKKSKSKK